MSYAYQTLAATLEGRVLTLKLNRPDKLNAFTVEMANELVDFFTRVNDDDAVGAVVVAGEGRAFCAGMDLSREGNVFGLDESLEPTMRDMHERLDDPVIVEGVRDTGGRVTLAIHACRKPVIAAIHGAAVGIGATMTLAMDIRLVADNAKVGFVFGRLGIVPEACSSWFLPRLVGLQRALDWVYSARIVEAPELRESGLALAVHPAAELLAAAQRLAATYVEGRSAVSVALMRQLMLRNLGADSPLQAHRTDSLAMFYTSRADGHEGVRAFLEKRAPVFTAKASTDMPPFYPW
jgi:enoyl-CoA hydratase/carnithine racemase